MHRAFDRCEQYILLQLQTPGPILESVGTDARPSRPANDGSYGSARHSINQIFDAHGHDQLIAIDHTAQLVEPAGDEDHGRPCSSSESPGLIAFVDELDSWYFGNGPSRGTRQRRR